MSAFWRKLFYKTCFPDEFRLMTRLGCRWLLNYGNYVDRKLILGKPFETRQLAYLSEQIDRCGCDTFIDVGANFGLYSVLLMRRCKGLARGYAVEPQLRNFQQLNANLLLNGLSDAVTTLCVGASSSSRTVSFLENPAGNTGTSRVSETAPSSTNPEKYVAKTIRVEPLDSLIALPADARCAIKIDVEGHELEVLYGVRALLASRPCLIQTEILERADGKLASLAETLDLHLLQSIDEDYYLANRAMLAVMGREPSRAAAAED